MAERDGTATAGALATVCLGQAGSMPRASLSDAAASRVASSHAVLWRRQWRGQRIRARDNQGHRPAPRGGRRWVVLVILWPTEIDRTSTRLVYPWTTFSTSPSSTIRFARWCVIFRASISRPSRASWTRPPPSPGTTSRRWASSACSACRGARSSAAPGWTRSPTTSPSTRWRRWTRATRSPSARTPTSAPPHRRVRHRGAEAERTFRCSPPGGCWAASD